MLAVQARRLAISGRKLVEAERARRKRENEEYIRRENEKFLEEAHSLISDIAKWGGRSVVVSLSGWSPTDLEDQSKLQYIKERLVKDGFVVAEDFRSEVEEHHRSGIMRMVSFKDLIISW